MKAIRIFFGRVNRFFKRLGKIRAEKSRKVLSYLDRNPNRSFYIFLGIMLLLIVVSNIIGTPKPAEVKTKAAAKKVELYTIGSAPRVEVIAKIEKSGVVTVTALAPGVVSAINKTAGATVGRGQTLISLSSNYQGGNSSSLARSLAEVQFKNANETYDIQKEIIKKQRELAEKADVNADEIRGITDKSIDETNALINLNSEIISSLDTNIANLESTNVGGANDVMILSTKQLKSQFLAGTNAARQGLRMAEFSASGDKAPAEMSNLQREMTLKQLELQEKMLDMQKEISGIQLKIARVVEAMMYPAAPFAGTVERVFVKKGQSVNPGTPLAVIGGNGEGHTVTAVAHVTSGIAGSISRLEDSVVHVNSTVSYKAAPDFVSGEPVQGTLHAVYFYLPAEFRDKATEGGFIKIELPVGYADSAGSVPFIPIDSVYQTKDKNYVFVEEKGIAKSREVELGGVLGSFVEVTEGLVTSDRVIKSRNIIAGDAVVGNGK